MKRTVWKRTLSLLLAVVMCIGMVPAMAMPAAALRDYAGEKHGVNAENLHVSHSYAHFAPAVGATIDHCK